MSALITLDSKSLLSFMVSFPMVTSSYIPSLTLLSIVLERVFIRTLTLFASVGTVPSARAAWASLIAVWTSDTWIAPAFSTAVMAASRPEKVSARSMTS